MFWFADLNQREKTINFSSDPVHIHTGFFYNKDKRSNNKRDQVFHQVQQTRGENT